MDSSQEGISKDGRSRKYKTAIEMQELGNGHKVALRWYLFQCMNCETQCLQDAPQNFLKCKCGLGLLRFLCAVEADLKEIEYVASDMPATETELNAAIDKDKLYES